MREFRYCSPAAVHRIFRFSRRQCFDMLRSAAWEMKPSYRSHSTSRKFKRLRNYFRLPFKETCLCVAFHFYVSLSASQRALFQSIDFPQRPLLKYRPCSFPSWLAAAASPLLYGQATGNSVRLGKNGRSIWPVADGLRRIHPT